MDKLDAMDTKPTVLVITGAGRSFCAGMDLKEVIIDEDPTIPRQLLETLARLTHRIRLFPAVTLARVNGAAIGGGCGLSTVCDISITHEDAKLGFPEVDLGLCPAVVAPWLVRKIGAGKARQVLLTGGLMSGARAAEFGIVTHAVESREQLDEAVSGAAPHSQPADPTRSEQPSPSSTRSTARKTSTSSSKPPHSPPASSQPKTPRTA